MIRPEEIQLVLHVTCRFRKAAAQEHHLVFPDSFVVNLLRICGNKFFLVLIGQQAFIPKRPAGDKERVSSEN